MLAPGICWLTYIPFLQNAHNILACSLLQRMRRTEQAASRFKVEVLNQPATHDNLLR